MFIFLVSLQVSFAVASNTSENSQTTLHNPLQSSSTPYTFTYFKNSTNSEVHVFTATLTNNSAVLTDYTFDNLYPIYGGQEQTSRTLDLSSLNSTINNFYYYNSGKHHFYIMRRNYNSFDIFVDSFNSSDSYHLSGPFKLLSVNQYDNSTDVYFTLCNRSVLLIIKYVNSISSFTVFYESNNLNTSNYEIGQADAFMFDDQLFIDYNYGNSTTQNFNSSVLIFKYGQIYPTINKTFNSKKITSLFPYKTGLLLYSMSKDTFYSYNYSTNNIIQQIYHNGYNISSIRPFSYTSFLSLENNSITINNVSYGTASGFQILIQNRYYISNPNYPFNENTIQAFSLGSNYVYLLNINYNNQYVFTVDNIDVNPGTIAYTTPTSSYYNYSTITSTQGYYTGFYTTTYSGSNILGVVLILLFILLIAGIGIAYVASNKNRNRYYPPRNNSYLNNYIDRNQRKRVSAKNFCDSCGAMVLQEDIFCQNCGHRLN